MEYIILLGILVSILFTAVITLLLLDTLCEKLQTVPIWKSLSCHLIQTLGIFIYGYFLYVHLIRIYSVKIAILPAATVLILSFSFFAVKKFYTKKQTITKSPPAIAPYTKHLAISGILFTDFMVLFLSAIYFSCHFIKAVPIQLTREEFSYIDYHLAQAIMLAIIFNLLINLHLIYSLSKDETAEASKTTPKAIQELYQIKKHLKKQQ